MAWKKGESGNSNGRPVGSTNKVNTALKERLLTFLEANFETMMEDYQSLEPKERIKIYTSLIEHAIPKLSRAENTINFETLTEEQLDFIIHELKNKLENE